MGAVSKTLAFGGGKLIAGPANAVAPTFGGTTLGTVQAIELLWRKITYACKGEEYGGATVKHFLLRYEVELRVTGLSADQDLLVEDVGSEVVTNPDGVPTITVPTRSYGAPFSGRSILFAPYRPEDAGFLIWEAVGLGPGGALSWSNYQSRKHRAVFEARLDAAGRLFISDIVSRLPL